MMWCSIMLEQTRVGSSRGPSSLESSRIGLRSARACSCATLFHSRGRIRIANIGEVRNDCRSFSDITEADNSARVGGVKASAWAEVA